MHYVGSKRRHKRGGLESRCPGERLREHRGQLAGNAAGGSNILKHIESLERMKEKLETELRNEKSKNEKISAKTRETLTSCAPRTRRKGLKFAFKFAKDLLQKS